MDRKLVEIDCKILRVKGEGPNFSRELREVRGSGEFSWVTRHVFRKTCATSSATPRSSMTQDNSVG